MQTHQRARRSNFNATMRAGQKRRFGALRKLGYEIKELTEYQFRVNGVLDIYITNNKWHDLKTGERGEYESLTKFLKTYTLLNTGGKD